MEHSKAIQVGLSSQVNNPDMRVQILQDFVKQHFPSTQLLDYALDVEKITTSKVRPSVAKPLKRILNGVALSLTVILHWA